MVEFVAENIWSILVLLPGAIIVFATLAKRGTKITINDCPTALKAAFLDANEPKSWGLRE
jgi:hypothetical protein